MNYSRTSFLAVALMGTLILASCGHNLRLISSRYQELPLYTAVDDLPDGETPAVICVRDLPAMVSRYEAAGYIVVGLIRVEHGLTFSYSEVAALAEKRHVCVVLTNCNTHDNKMSRAANAGAALPPPTSLQYGTPGQVQLLPDEPYYLFLSPRG